MNTDPTSKSTTYFQRPRAQDTDEKHKVLAVKTHIRKEAGFSIFPETKIRKIRSTTSKPPDFCLQKAALEQRGKKYFFENLPLILHQNQILSQCPFFDTPIRLDDGSIYEKIKTVVCSDVNNIKSSLRALRNTELAFIVYYRNKNNTLKLTLSLFSNKSCDNHNIKKMTEGYLGSGLEFFGLAVTLTFDSYNDLITVSLGRGVNETFRRNGICTLVSLATLTKIYEYLGSEKTIITSYSASHIGTVKFYYPLHGLFKKNTLQSLRDFDPRNSSLTFDDIEKHEESLEIFQFEPSNKFATCPDRVINLEKLLLQYQVRDALMKEMGGNQSG